MNLESTELLDLLGSTDFADQAACRSMLTMHLTSRHTSTTRLTVAYVGSPLTLTPHLTETLTALAAPYAHTTT